MPAYDETIAAIATPPGRGAVGMVRLSGDKTIAIISRVFSPLKEENGWESHRMYHGFIVQNNQKKDEVMAVVYRRPRSYTREDVGEIYTHGGMAAVRGVLEAVLANGARPAMPGEFTQRAFLNGRINLTQAEAVMDLINAKTDAAIHAGIRQLGGGLSDKVNHFRDRLLKWLAHIELSIDYPEHESEAMNVKMIARECETLLADMYALLQTSKMGRILTEGVRTAIIGRPNVGKSSLLNAILQEERAIVTEIPGTTRDTLAELTQVHGLPLLITDTAGIRDTEDVIEKQGVMKSTEQAETADLIFFVADGSEPPQLEDLAILAMLDRLNKKNVIMCINKSDLPLSEAWEKYANTIKISAKEQTGLNRLYDRIRDIFFTHLDPHNTEAAIITRERHRFLLQQAITKTEETMQAIENNVPEDLISVTLKAAYLSLNELVGEEIGDDVANRIFSEFCVGK